MVRLPPGLDVLLVSGDGCAADIGPPLVPTLRPTRASDTMSGAHRGLRRPGKHGKTAADSEWCRPAEPPTRTSSIGGSSSSSWTIQHRLDAYRRLPTWPRYCCLSRPRRVLADCSHELRCTVALQLFHVACRNEEIYLKEERVLVLGQERLRIPVEQFSARSRPIGAASRLRCCAGGSNSSPRHRQRPLLAGVADTSAWKRQLGGKLPCITAHHTDSANEYPQTYGLHGRPSTTWTAPNGLELRRSGVQSQGAHEANPRSEPPLGTA